MRFAGIGSLCLLICIFQNTACQKESSPKPESQSASNTTKADVTSEPKHSSSKSDSVSRAARAKALAHQFIIVDGHVDLPFRLHIGRIDGKISEDVSLATAKGDFDYPRARKGGLDAPFQSIYIPSKYQQSGGAKKLADLLIDSVEAIVEAHPDKFAMAPDPAAVRANFKAGKVSFPLGIENGAAIEKRLENLTHFRKRGVSYMTLTHATDNALSDSSYADTNTHGGLSSLGKKAIAEMNRVGILVDVSHVSDEAFLQAIALSAVPVIASHSSLRHFVPGFERNVSDKMLKKLGAAGGVIMINFGSGFLLPGPNTQSKKRQELAKAYALEHKLSREVPEERKQIMAHVDGLLPMQFARVQDVADHIDRVRQLVGVEHIGFGSDFDGVGDSLPEGLKDASAYPRLVELLLERNYSETDIAKICSGNVLRVWQQALDHAAVVTSSSK